VVKLINGLIEQITAFNTVIDGDPEFPQDHNRLDTALCDFTFPNGCIEQHATIEKIATVVSTLERDARILWGHVDPTDAYKNDKGCSCTIL
jgi:hypothetical protein